ncbi:MAG: FKBP-type peptidyl-prolyl cis-trans isomerase [Balneolaceae bacterium]
MKQHSTTVYLLFAFSVFLFLYAGCDDSTGPRFVEPDYSTVPEMADTSNAEKVELDDGLTYYVIEEGGGQAKVVSRDAITMYVTLRRSNGEVLSSTYANSRTTPQSETVDRYTDAKGFKLGVLGMKEGEHRIIVIPPSLGFTGTTNAEVRNDTITYEVELVRILDQNS